MEFLDYLSQIIRPFMTSTYNTYLPLDEFMQRKEKKSRGVRERERETRESLVVAGRRK